MRVLVTGASGFIGGHLLALLLERGHSVRALIRAGSDTRALPDSTVVERAFGDLDPARGDERDLGKALDQIDAVIHCGGTTRKVQAREEDLFRINRDGAARLAELCSRSSARPRLVLVSSISALGPSLDLKPLREEQTPHPRSAYGRSKLAGEEAVRAHGGALNWTMVRLPAVVGPRDINLVPLFKLARRGVRLSGPQLANFIHVKDACELLIRAALEPRATGQLFHAAGKDLSLSDLGRSIAAGLNRKTIPIRIPNAALFSAAFLAGQLGRLRKKPASLDLEKADELVRDWPLDGARATECLGYQSSPPLDPPRVREIEASYLQAGWL